MQPERVLVVDDEEAVAGGFVRILEQAGYVTMRAKDGLDAGRKLAEATFDVMVTDIFMPEREGLETVKDAHRRYPKMRIVVASGGCAYGSLDTWLKIARAFGASATLKKPVAASDLLRAVRGVDPGADGAPPP